MLIEALINRILSIKSCVNWIHTLSRRLWIVVPFDGIYNLNVDQSIEDFTVSNAQEKKKSEGAIRISKVHEICSSKLDIMRTENSENSEGRCSS